MNSPLTARTGPPVGILAAMFALALTAGMAWSEPGSASQSEPGSADQAEPRSTEKEEAKARAPELIVVRFYADWCGYCKALDAELDEVREKLAEKPVLFVQLDLTDETTRPQAELLSAVLGIDELWAEYNQRTGFAVLVEPGSGEAAGELSAGQDAEELHQIISDHVSG